MSTFEYWIGDGIDLRKTWSDYFEGRGYEQKFRSMQVHLIEFTFQQFPANLPLFTHEALFKTFKAYFHEIKKRCFSPSDYDKAGPLYIYEVSRGSSKWAFLGELRQLLLYGTTLAGEKLIGQKLENVERRLNILKNHFGDDVRPEDYQAFMNARTAPEIDAAVQHLLAHKILQVNISKFPFEGDIVNVRREMIDLKKIDEESKR